MDLDSKSEELVSDLEKSCTRRFNSISPTKAVVLDIETDGLDERINSIIGWCNQGGGGNRRIS